MVLKILSNFIRTIKNHDIKYLFKIWEELIIKISISENIKTTDNKIEQNKPQYNSYGETANISALSSGNVSKYEFPTDKDALPEKNLLELKRFEYSPLG